MALFGDDKEIEGISGALESLQVSEPIFVFFCAKDVKGMGGKGKQKRKIYMYV